MAKQRPIAIDLFCGAGGLSLGLTMAGFRVAVGVELKPDIAKTYAFNHRKTKTLIKDAREIRGEDILKLAGTENIDLLAGCPPCQGFSQLTEKYKREDSRNGLVLEMARLIKEIKPKMVMMENVPGITTKGKKILDTFINALRDDGYMVNTAVLQMADFGVPQSRRRFVLVAGKGFNISLPQPTHSSKADEKYNLKPWVTLADSINDMPSPKKLSHASKRGGPEKFNWHVIRDLREISIRRLKVIREGQNRFVLPKELRPRCHRSLTVGFRNSYGRLSWNSVSGTITSGCTTPCKGRFGHPSEDRTISIREAAVIQTFPLDYAFKTNYMDVACDLVGNALPPRFAAVAGRACIDAFKNLEGVSNE